MDSKGLEEYGPNGTKFDGILVGMNELGPRACFLVT